MDVAIPDFLKQHPGVVAIWQMLTSLACRGNLPAQDEVFGWATGTITPHAVDGSITYEDADDYDQSG